MGKLARFVTVLLLVACSVGLLALVLNREPDSPATASPSTTSKEALSTSKTTTPPQPRAELDGTPEKPDTSDRVSVTNKPSARTSATDTSAALQPVPSTLPDRAVILQQSETTPDADGLFVRTQLVRVELKYPFLRIEETIRRDAVTSKEKILQRREMVADHILVQLKQGSSEEELIAINLKYGASIRRKMATPGMYLVELPAPDLESVPIAVEAYGKETQVVAYAEPDSIAHIQETLPNDPDFGLLYGLHNTGQENGTPGADINAPAAWDLVTGGDVVIGVIDTGVDYRHPDLTDNMWVNPGEIPGDQIDNDNNGYVDDVYGWDFYNDDNDPMDDNSHGTHCAGTIAASGDNGAGIVGVNWHANIMALKFLGASGSGPISDAVDAQTYANEMRSGHGVTIRLTSNSWGSDSPSQAMSNAIEASRQLDMLFIAAAGNAGRDTDVYPHYPSSRPHANLISVAATDRNDRRAGFSNYGHASVDLGAPGVSIRSTIPENAYGLKSGTSMATPHVAGVAALLWNFSPDETWQSIKDAILLGTDPISTLQDITVSGGRLNALRAIHNLGMRVRGSSPAHDEIVLSPPLRYTIMFTEAYDATTLQPADLSINGVPADSLTMVEPDVVHFDFTASPVTTEGAQSLYMAPGSVQSTETAERLGEYSATFRYDRIPMDVVATIPPNDGKVSLPFLSLRIDLNEPYAPSSVDIGDLILTKGRVIDVQMIDTDTLEYSFADIEDEGPLVARLRKGALADVYANPSRERIFTFDLDVTTTPYPGPLRMVMPAGSLVYRDPPATGFVTPAADTDSFTIQVDAGQSIAILVEPGNDLQPSVTLFGPDQLPLSSATATESGTTVMLQATQAEVAGTYSLVVAGAAGTTGPYTARVHLNAAIEGEHYTGIANDSHVVAELLDPHFLSLEPFSADRVAVMGRMDIETYRTLMAEDFETETLGSAWNVYSSDPDGRVRASDAEGAFSGTHALLMDRSTAGAYSLNEAEWTIDLAGCESAILRFSHASWYDESQNFGNDFTGHETADGIAISDDGHVWHPLWNGPGDVVRGDWIEHTLELSSGAIEAGMRLGPQFRIRFQQYDNGSFPDDGRGWDNLSIEVPNTSEDWYAFSLKDGDAIDVSVVGIDGITPRVTLCDASGLELRTGQSGHRDIDSHVSNFVANETGLYHVRVSAKGDATYNLVITRNVQIDVEPNDTSSDSQALGDSGRVLGAIHSPPQLFAMDWKAEPAHILRLDPVTLAVCDRIKAPMVPNEHPSRVNLAFDGDFLWFSSGSDSGTAKHIFKLDPLSGDILDSFATSLSLITGLAALNGEIYASDTERMIHVFDDTTFAKVRTLSPTLAGGLAGLEGDAQRGILWGSSYWQRIYEIDPITGTAVERRNYGGEREGIEQGLAIVDNVIFVAEGSVNRIAAYDAETLASIRRMNAPVSTLLGGLGGNNAATSEDWFHASVTAGDQLVVMTSTPAGDRIEPGEFRNALDPTLELYDLSGNLVGADDNGATDGRNARLTHTASLTGIYTIRVRGQDNTRGEYILQVSGTTGKPDEDPPQILCPVDETIECGETPEGIATATDTSDPNPSITFLDDRSGLAGCNGTGSMIRTWIATDLSGNSDSCDQMITISDSAPPIIMTPPDETIECDAQPIGMATATDSCDPAPSLTFTDQPAPAGFVRTWTATDACGNTAYTSQLITILDTTPPVITSCPPDDTVAVKSTCEHLLQDYTTAVQAYDSCEEVTITQSPPNGSTISGGIIVTLTATDVSGNSTTCTLRVVPEDSETPLVACPADRVVECGADTTATGTGMATASDNCDTSLAPTFSDSIASNCGESLTITRTWTATDSAGNEDVCQQTILVVDTTPPTLSGVPTGTTINCGTPVPSDPGTVTAHDACMGDVTDRVVFTPGTLVTNSSCPNTGTVTHTWSVDDGCGNSVNLQQLIIITDSTGPTLTTPEDITIGCGSDTSPGTTGAAVAADTCDPYPEVRYTDSINGSCPEGQAITRTWIATDACGNSTSSEQRITILDPTYQWVELQYTDFETGWSQWTDGGNDCKLYTGGIYSHQGFNAANIQDNSRIASSFYSTQGIDLRTPGYQQLKVEFWFMTTAMNGPSEAFHLQYWDGETWLTLASYAHTIDFENQVFYFEEVLIDADSYTFPPNMRLRFLCDASANNDDVYIDEIRISAIGASDNQPPVARDDQATTDQDTPVVLDVLRNDSDPDGDPLTLTSLTQPENGSAATDGTHITYSPDPGFTGPDTFTYDVADDQGAEASARVYVNVIHGGLTFETGIVSAPGTWTTVSLANQYTSPVVVCTANYANHSQTPTVVRVRNAASSSFDVKLQAASRAPVTPNVVHYIVIEEGAWQLPDGRAIEAQRILSTGTSDNRKWNSSRLEKCIYQNTYDNPVVLGQVMTTTDPAWSTFWCRGDSRDTPPTASTCYVGKHVGEDRDKLREGELLGVLILEAGSGSVDGQPYQAGLSADTLRGIDDAPPYSIPLSAFSTAPQIGLVGIAGMDDRNGGWAVSHGMAPLQQASFGVAIDEDGMEDKERSHRTEQAGYLVFQSEWVHPVRTDVDVADSLNLDSSNPHHDTKYATGTSILEFDTTDTDHDRWPDILDATISRAYIDWGNPNFIEGDVYHYPGPAWWIDAFKTGGTWLDRPTCWRPSTYAPSSLQLELDRTFLHTDVIMQLVFFDAPAGFLHVDLLDAEVNTVADNVYGNLVAGSGGVVREYLRVPLQQYPEAVSIRLRGGPDTLYIYESLLYVDEDFDGLDREQEEQLGTLDSQPNP